MGHRCVRPSLQTIPSTRPFSAGANLTVQPPPATWWSCATMPEALGQILSRRSETHPINFRAALSSRAPPFRGPMCPHWVKNESVPLFPSPSTPTTVPRSEEHTSELQSLTNLVCRLLLETKKY